jgi:hypothetical protein
MGSTVYVGNPPLPLAPLPIRPGARITLGMDSVAAGFNAGNSSTDATFAIWNYTQTLMNSAFVAAGAKPPVFTNTGLVGQTTAAWLAGLTAQVINTNPTDVWLNLAINDVITIVSPATTAANLTSAITTTLISFPNCHFHVFGTGCFTSEAWPDGSAAGPSNGGAAALTNAAMMQAVQAFPNNARWYNLRQYIYTWEAANNPTVLASGLVTQDGTHPTKIGQRPAGQSGQEVFGLYTFNALTLQFT